MDINKYIGNKIREFRENKNLTQEDIAAYLKTTSQTISRYEIGDRKANNDILFELAKYFKISINDFFPPLSFDNAEAIENENIVFIPVLGTIKAGLPIEAQQEILEYIDIPKNWTDGGKVFYGLKISGNSMTPKYNENDIVIFEKTEDMLSADNKDCAVMVNGDDATFKKVSLNDNGIILIPYNTNEYNMMIYSKEEIANKPVRIIGIAREKRTRL